MIRSFGIAALMALLLAAPASAQLITDLVAFPVVARGPGLHGTQWVSDLTLFNPMDHGMNVFVGFLPANQNNGGSQYLTVYFLDSGETMMVEDVLQTAFGIDGDDKGMLTLNVNPDLTQNPEGSVVEGVTRTYNTGAGEGTYGQTVPGLMPAFNVGWASSFITGARNDDSYRSNLGIASASITKVIRVYFEITSSDGTVLAEGFKDIHIQSMNQWSFDQLGIGAEEGPLTVELWLDADDASQDPCAGLFPNGFFAYVSKVDNLTGDAEFIYAYPMAPYLCPEDE